MGSSCCSHAKEPKEITITKPEKNMITNNINEKNNANNNLQILDLEKSAKNQNISNTNFSQPLDINSFQNTSSPLTQKEIDELLNQAFSNNNQKEVNNNINNIPPSQYDDLNLNNLYQNQETNNQNIQYEQDLEKLIPSSNNYQNQNNETLNLDEILKKQSNQSKTDYDIEEILKNTELKLNEQNNNNVNNNINDMNLDIFFNQNGNEQINDEFIDKIFESTEKRENNNPLLLSQKIESNQSKNNVPQNNQYYSSGNATQRSGALGTVSPQFKQIYEFK